MILLPTQQPTQYCITVLTVVKLWDIVEPVHTVAIEAWALKSSSSQEDLPSLPEWLMNTFTSFFPKLVLPQNGDVNVS